MLIDFHVHMFPDKIAERTLNMLLANMRDTYNIDQKLHYAGTLGSLYEKMAETGVDISIIQPIATKPAQHTSINNFAEEIRSDKVISFGSFHPYGDNLNVGLDDLIERGFKGIKLHPDYQGVCADDDRFIELVKNATAKGLYVTIHSGEDTGIKPPFKGSVDRICRLLNKVDASRVILAHMGAFGEWDDVEKYLIESDAYFDISVVSRFINPEQYSRIIHNHGADKILFGSDLPWESPSETLAFLKQADITEAEFELITHKNAEKILNLEKNFKKTLDNSK